MLIFHCYVSLPEAIEFTITGEHPIISSSIIPLYIPLLSHWFSYISGFPYHNRTFNGKLMGQWVELSSKEPKLPRPQKQSPLWPLLEPVVGTVDGLRGDGIYTHIFIYIYI